jgi:hypothetical protein
MFTSISASGQFTYQVEYVTKQRTVFPDSVKNQKVEGKIVYKDSNNVTQTVTTPFDFKVPDFDFEAVFTIVANDSSSKMFFGSIDHQKNGVAIMVNTPDTIYYSRGNWTRLYEGNLEAVNVQTFKVKETKETKVILGFQCSKFVTDNEDVIFWASKKLPNTLLPHTGLQGFKFGILEIQNLKDNIHTIARKVTKIKTF